MMNICGTGVFIVFFMCFASVQGKKISKAISSVEFMPDQKGNVCILSNYTTISKSIETKNWGKVIDKSSSFDKHL